MSFQIALPSLPQGSSRYGTIHTGAGLSGHSVEPRFRVLAFADLSKIFFGNRVGGSSRQLAGISNRHSDGRGSLSSLPKITLNSERPLPLPHDHEEAFQFGVASQIPAIFRSR